MYSCRATAHNKLITAVKEIVFARKRNLMVTLFCFWSKKAIFDTS